MKLYRYIRALDVIDGKTILSARLKGALEESKIYFSHPASFNDPLECTIPLKIDEYDLYKDKFHDFIEKTVSSAIGKREDATDRNKRIYEAIEFGIPSENCLIICFAKDGNNQLMWSHYADQHKGICLCYEFPDSTDEWISNIEWSSSIRYDMENYDLQWYGNSVIYQKKRPALEIANPELPTEKWTLKNDYKITDAIFTKPLCWAYEQEWRLALFLPFGSKVAFAAGINTSAYHATLPREWLTEITFGLRLDKKYCDEIIKTITDSKYPNVSFRKAKMAHDEFRIVNTEY